MSRTICLGAYTLHYPEGAGHFWVYLNWALGIKRNGHDVIWLERIDPKTPLSTLLSRISVLRSSLASFGLNGPIALSYDSGARALPEHDEWISVEDAAAHADMLLNLNYHLPSEVVALFRRSVLVDIDPGLTQFWMSGGHIRIAQHSMYFTIGENVGTSDLIPDCGLKWHYTPPCVALECWPWREASADAPFTTISQWGRSDWEVEWVQDGADWYKNGKRDGFLPFLGLPELTHATLELALNLGPDSEDEKSFLESLGWLVRDAHEVAGSLDHYRAYIGRSKGEFSCVKPSCIRFQNAWISDRTLCYLASGKPAVIQNTGPSRFLPDRAGLLRFKTIEEAAACLDDVTNDYERHCGLARKLAQDYFDASVVARNILERALP